MRILLLTASLLAAAALAGPASANRKSGPPVETAKSAVLGKPAVADGEAADRQAMSAFYASNAETALWVTASGLNARGVAVVGEIRKAGDRGLELEAFQLPDIAVAGNGAAPLDLDTLKAAETALTLAVLKYARHARGGRIGEPSRQLSSYIDRTPQLIEPRLVLESIAQASDPAAYLRSLHPQNPGFEKLRQSYLKLSTASTAADAVVTIPAGPMLKPGMKHAHVALLRQRLGVAAEPSGDETIYDPALVEAVKTFQRQKGQSADGYVGAATRAAFNDVEVLSTERLLANMEMYRWLPDNLGDFYIWVNIPEFMMRVVKAGAVIHEERVITGLPDKQTPVFSDEIELVTFHPRWNVPNSIKVRELYPSLARGGSYVQKQGIRISYAGRVVNPEDVDWSSADIRKYEVYQPPGSNNVLGRLKFSFPNKHEVYMHDTSTKGLFEEASRPFSHGCMRVRNPERLAEIVLQADKGWDAARVLEALEAQPVENPVKLDKRVPVHVTYFTVTADKDGTNHLFKDVYGHEKRVIQALAGEWSQIAVGPDHLAPVTYGPGRYAGGGNALETFVNNLFGGF